MLTHTEQNHPTTGERHQMKKGRQNVFIQSNCACAPLLFLSDDGKGRGGSLINGMQRGNTRRAAEVGADPGNGVATFSENYAFTCVWREHLGFPSSRKGQAKLKEKFLTRMRRQGNSDSRLMAPTGRGFQGWVLVGRGKSGRR